MEQRFRDGRFPPSGASVLVPSGRTARGATPGKRGPLALRPHRQPTARLSAWLARDKVVKISRPRHLARLFRALHPVRAFAVRAVPIPQLPFGFYPFGRQSLVLRPKMLALLATDSHCAWAPPLAVASTLSPIVHRRERESNRRRITGVTAERTRTHRSPIRPAALSKAEMGRIGISRPHPGFPNRSSSPQHSRKFKQHPFSCPVHRVGNDTIFMQALTRNRIWPFFLSRRRPAAAAIAV
jgi:hypothetical protein